MEYTKVQSKGIENIKQITARFGELRWFTQYECDSGLNTLDALVRKGYLKTQNFNGLPYYMVVE